MSDKKNNTGFGERAQEMLMLDMLDGMHEFFTQSAYRSSLANSFKIVLEEELNNVDTSSGHCQDDSAVVISFSEARARRIAQQDNRSKKTNTQLSLIKS